MAVIDKAQADPALAVLIRQETAETRAEKKGWATLWDRLSAAAAVLVLVVVAMPGVARAKAIEINGLDQGKAAVCILCSKQDSHPSGQSLPALRSQTSPRATLSTQSPQCR